MDECPVTTIVEHPLELMGHCAPDPCPEHQSHSLSPLHRHSQISLVHYSVAAREALWLTRKHTLSALRHEYNMFIVDTEMKHVCFNLSCLWADYAMGN